MFCTQCGAPLPERAAFCPRCGAQVAPASPTVPGVGDPLKAEEGSPGAPAAVPPPGAPDRNLSVAPQVVVTPPAAPYAGFWRRFVAVVIDALILSFVMFPINLALRVPIYGILNQDEPSIDQFLSLMRVSFTSIAIGTLINWLYSALMESSKLQGTLGKMALNIKVTDLELRRISFGRASGRFFGKILSKLILLIGYLMQPFTARRQALHDMLAGTLVVRRGASE